MTDVQDRASTTSPATISPEMIEASRRDDVSDLTTLEALYGEVQGLSIDKVTPSLTPLMIEFLNVSSMYFLATADASGRCDVSPRGDPAGAVRVADPTTLILPDRRGNRRVDSLRNLIVNDLVGLLFLVAGSDDTLRINGRATLSMHQSLLDAMPMQGKAPNLAVIVDIDEAYMHCPRAFRRSGLWNPETWPDTGTFPTMTEILHQQLHMPGAVEELARERDERARKTLY
jgi:PPOX class probable FMN-dependent enzyme